jgi:protein phosphatase inhibitor 2
MKINEPKTPYAKHYDPTEDPDSDEERGAKERVVASGTDLDLDKIDGVKGYSPSNAKATKTEDEIPGLSLGEPEEAVPEGEFAAAEGSQRKRPRAVHVDSNGDAADEDIDDEQVGMTAEEKEKHRRFEEMRKKHYEMKSVARFLGHPEDMEDGDDEGEDDDGDDEGAPPPMPKLPAQVNGS